jgi:hypothetical protein
VAVAKALLALAVLCLAVLAGAEHTKGILHPMPEVAEGSTQTLDSQLQEQLDQLVYKETTATLQLGLTQAPRVVEHS